MTEETQETKQEVKKAGFSISTPVAIIVAGLFIAGAVIYANKTPQQPAPNGGQQQLSAKEVQKILTVRDDDYILGNPDAPVTFFEFGDFECPFCAKFHAEAWQDIVANYVDTGKVRVIWRHFPLNSIHPLAQPAAEASECAGEQGKFWEYHDGVYETPSLTASALISVGQDIGLDMNAFQACLEAGTYSQKVADDFDLGRKVNVTGTPTFFINGNPIIGALPFSDFEPVIEQELR
ncbi:MAG: hypothetical protein COU47_03150 [Candidatus Niyogibacteria bacterium CG10_big_fil_rev_8_21_14_0_10_46_36]|uniref:Thioredoxin domain-containing protein n=1 Tax=Candidatus Niyogibacteria bacterium CG10_big_fil_rev_8_21_14_0_10_46_36 TaxID=1974726 RepID=A0A2H0TCR1_9BACT|nr:MAG: hypothetical protein COU47_03150 [Candidatus Niyogibacteria bacterium CG10_big_fil_rev_8_21_14_0_10_46_36]